MKNIKNYIREFKNRFALSGFVTSALGALLVIYPSFTGKALCYAIAGLLLAKGTGSLIRQYRYAGGNFVPYTMMGGLSTVMLGLFVALRYDLIISIIPFVFGIFLLTSSVSSIQRALTLKSMNYAGWNHGLFFTVIKVIMAAVIVINPFGTAMALTRFIGACLLYDGLSGLITVFETAKAKSAFNKAQENLRNMNLAKDDFADSEEIPVVQAEFVEIIKEVREDIE